MHTFLHSFKLNESLIPDINDNTHEFSCQILAPIAFLIFFQLVYELYANINMTE